MEKKQKLKDLPAQGKKGGNWHFRTSGKGQKSKMRKFGR